MFDSLFCLRLCLKSADVLRCGALVCSVFAGYYSTRTYKMFKLTEWRQNTLYTALLFPGFFFGVFFILNLVIWGEKSSGAVPFGTLVALLVLWFCISLPLVYLGRYVCVSL
jgi:transmembrane 9 superfamily protein 2/4